ncbi:hypothetical protein ACIPJQ_10895 [Streptomyces griseoviridis]
MNAVDMDKSSQGLGRGLYFAFTVVVMAIGWMIAAGNTGISYLSLSTDLVPIITGVVGCLLFITLVRVLHHAWWLAVLSAFPALLILIGSVQYPREAAMESRGVRTHVTVTADSAAGTGSNAHRFTLEGPDGPLEETLDYDGTDPNWRVGDQLVVVSDPEETVSLMAAPEADPGRELSMLGVGVAGWTAITLLAGLRGYIRRREGRSVLVKD